MKHRGSISENSEAESEMGPPELDLLNVLTSIETAKGIGIPLRVNHALVDSIRRVLRDPTLTQVLRALQTEVDLRKLLWSHRYQFTPLKGLDLPFIYHEARPFSSAEPLRVERSRAEAELEVRVRDATERLLPSIVQAVQSFDVESFTKIEETLETNFQAIQDAMPDRSEEEIRQIVISGYFIQRFGLVTDSKGLDDWVQKGIRHAGDLGLPIASNLLSLTKQEILKAGRRHLEQLSSTAGLDEEAMDSLVSRLSKEFRAILPALSLVWCSECVAQTQVQLVLGHRELPTSACPGCRREMSSGTFHYFISPLAALMAKADGIVGTTVLFSLATSGASWAPGVYLKGAQDDTEKDAIFRTNEMEGYGIVEVKMHSKDTPERTMRDRMREDLGQLHNHYDKYEQAGIPMEMLVLVTNLPRDLAEEAVRQQLRDDYSDSLRGKVKVFSPENYNSFAEMLEQSSEE